MFRFQIFGWRRGGKLEREGPARRQQRQTLLMRGHAPRSPWARIVPIAMVVAVWLTAACCIAWRSPRPPVSFVAGQQVPYDLYARAAFQRDDPFTTRLKRDEALRDTLDVWRLDNHLAARTRDSLDRFFEALDRRGHSQPPEAADRARLPALDHLNAEDLALLRSVFDTPDKRKYLQALLGELAGAGIVAPRPPGEVWPAGKQVRIRDEQAREQVHEISSRPTPSHAAEQLLAQFLSRFPAGDPRRVADLAHPLLAALIEPNLSYDDAATRERQELALAKVGTVLQEVPEGTLLLRKGTVIGTAEIELLNRHNHKLQEGTRQNQEYIWRQGSLMVLALLLVIAGALAVAVLRQATGRRRTPAALIGLIVCLNLLLVWGADQLFDRVPTLPLLLLLPVLPLLLAPVLASLLLGPLYGIAAGFFVTVLTSLLANGPLDGLYVLALGGVCAVAGALAVRSVRTRLQTFRAFAYAPLPAFAIVALYLFSNGVLWHYYPIAFGLLLANAVVCLMLANLLLPICEWVFGLTTNITLLELGDLNHSVLKRMAVEAPGTYHHTLNVATLAEHAAEAVGANPLLARVASYFHDIGKLSNPSYFTENSGGVDRHRDLSPRMSSLIILNHVKEGMNMARQLKLREPILEAIGSHQGTSLIYYFYRRAQDEELLGSNGSGEGDYRYPGPLPVSREASIIMLADCCEAACRSLEKPSAIRIKSLVEDLVQDKIVTGQLDESELTMQEVHRVSLSIQQTLANMHHVRVAYPAKDTARNFRPRLADDGEDELDGDAIPAPPAHPAAPAPDHPDPSPSTPNPDPHASLDSQSAARLPAGPAPAGQGPAPGSAPERPDPASASRG